MKKALLTALGFLFVCTAPALAGGEPEGSLRTWVDAGYLLWWLAPSPAPVPLLTTGPLTNPPSAGSGILGNPSTSVLTGNGPFDQGPYQGFQISAGWMHCSDAFGIEGSFFMLDQRSLVRGASSDANGNPVLARPIVDALTNSETALLVSAPGAFGGAAGSITLTPATRLFGADANLVLPVAQAGNSDDWECVTWFQLLGGFRYLNLREELNIASSSSILGNGIAFFDGLPAIAPSTIGITDDFRTLNQFYGGQVGVQGGLSWWLFTVDATAKVAVGTMREEVNINGSTTLHSPFGTNTVPGGLLALNSNIGSFTRNMVAVVPSGSLTLNVDITSQLKLMVGYTILYVSNVARPGDQIDRTVNRFELPSSQSFQPGLGGPARPAFSWSGTDFWAHGINVGLAFRF